VALRTQTRRVRALEDGSGGGGDDGCPRCGWGGDEDRTWELVFEDDSGEEEEEIFCSECGTQLIIFFDDDERAPWKQGSA
jgi:hypothetical protein